MGSLDYAQCFSSGAFFGEMDDFAIWGKTLTIAEIGAVWNSSLTSRANEGL